MSFYLVTSESQRDKEYFWIFFDIERHCDYSLTETHL